jgi:hypothetical protein
MSSLEERARAAVRATAAEIGPDDVPPPRAFEAGAGAGPDGRRLAGRAGGRRGRVWQWGIPLAAAAAVLAVVAAAGLLSGAVPPGAAHPAASAAKTVRHQAKPAHRAAASPAYPPNLVNGLIGFYLPASGAQYTAGALFTGEVRWLEGRITQRCLAGRGFPAQAIAAPAEIARAFWDLSQFPDLTAIAKAGMLPSYSVGPTPPETKAYQKAYDQCSSAALVPFAPMERIGRGFGDPFFTTVAGIESSAAVNATLPALRGCAARYGWPGQPYGAPDSTINSFDDFVNWIAGHIDGAGSRGASNAQLNALDRHWGTVFVRCARPTVAVMEKLQLAAQRAFLAAHRQELTKLIATARADFAAAERLVRG